MEGNSGDWYTLIRKRHGPLALTNVNNFNCAKKLVIVGGYNFLIYLVLYCMLNLILQYFIIRVNALLLFLEKCRGPL